MLLNFQTYAVQLPLGRMCRARAKVDTGAFLDIATDAKAQVIVFEQFITRLRSLTLKWTRFFVKVPFCQRKLLITAIVVTGIHTRLFTHHILAKCIFSAGLKVISSPPLVI